MNRFVCILFLLFCGVSTHAKDSTFIYFKKIGSEKVLKLKTPLKCRLYESKDDKRVGRIMSYTDSSVIFEYKDYDTSDVNEIMAMDSLSRKERFDLLDTLVKESKYTQEIHQDSIYKLRILSGSDTQGRQLVALGSAVIFMGSLGALLFDISTNVGGNFEWWYWLEISGMAAGATGVAVLMKRDIYFSKWSLLMLDDGS